MIPTHNTIPYSATPRATWALIGLCVAAFLYQMTLSGAAATAFLDAYALVPARYTDGSWATAHDLSRANPLPFLTNMSVYVCRRPRWPLAQMWPDMKMYL